MASTTNKSGLKLDLTAAVSDKPPDRPGTPGTPGTPSSPSSRRAREIQREARKARNFRSSLERSGSRSRGGTPIRAGTPKIKPVPGSEISFSIKPSVGSGRKGWKIMPEPSGTGAAPEGGVIDPDPELLQRVIDMIHEMEFSGREVPDRITLKV